MANANESIPESARALSLRALPKTLDGVREVIKNSWGRNERFVRCINYSIGG